MKYDKKSFLAGLTVGMQLKGWAGIGGIGGGVGGEPVAYLYNGVRLPPLPNWDKSKYPYAVLAYEEKELITPFLMLSDSEVVYDPAYQMSSYTYPVIMLYHPVYYGLNGETWSSPEELSYSPFEYNADRLIWTNTNIYNIDDNTLYCTASEPVPVYE